MIKIATEKTLDENATNNSSEINQLRLKLISSAKATLPKLKGTCGSRGILLRLSICSLISDHLERKLNVIFDHSTKQESDKDSPAPTLEIHNCIWNSNLRQIEQTIGKMNNL